MPESPLETPPANGNGNGAPAASSAPVTTREQLMAALARPHPPARCSFQDLLLQTGRITPANLQRAARLQAQHPEARLYELLLSNGLVSEDALYRTVAEQMGIPFVRLGEFDIDPDALIAVPQEVVRKTRTLPLMIRDGRLIVAADDPASTERLAIFKFRSLRAVDTVVATPSDLDTAISTHFPAIETSALVTEAEHLLLSRPEIEASAERLAQEKPLVRLVNNLLLDAVQRRASDIHIHAREHKADALFRIDGNLVPIGTFDRALLPAVVARIKVMASMDVAEHRLPQDGALHLTTPHGKVDMRVSMMPAIHGENVVIRILDPKFGLRKFADIGFTGEDENRMRALVNRNQGLVLVTGPTGSGKTTTLYAALQELNTGEFHILTVEDPVEYRLDGIVQMQVHEAIGFSFARALRHILRHDPDVILIGEIRDAETAKIAVESALTGHLVLSTLHTNSAAQAVTRLVEIGVEPYLLNATLAGVLAQRLVSRNCEHCRAEENVAPDIRTTLGVPETEKFWRGRGCEACNGSGHRGRIAVYELLEMTPAIRELVRTGGGHDQIEAQAEQEGMVRLTRHALDLARTGVIPLTEVFRARLD